MVLGWLSIGLGIILFFGIVLIQFKIKNKPLITTLILLVFQFILNPFILSIHPSLYLIIHFTFLIISFFLLFKSVNLQNQEMNLTDSITNLPNRLYFKQYGRTYFKNQMALVNLDISQFKLINEYSGYKSGDAILKQIAHRLESTSKDKDIVIRYGSDEFILIMEFTNKNELEENVHQLIKIINEPFMIKNKKVQVSCHVGVSLYPLHGTMDELVKKADIALQESKRLGFNKVVFFNEIIENRHVNRIKQVFELNHAINNEFLTVYYQPKANCTNQHITGLEALVRLNHPELGIISPMEFIPLAEELGLIDQIDLMVLKLVLKQLKYWEQASHPLINISINLSPQSFMNHDFIIQLDHLLEEYPIDCEYLSFEITETIALIDTNKTELFLRALKERHIKVYLDDFGKGYSSLNYLKMFDFDIVKIDKSYIDAIETEPFSQKVIHMLVELSTLLNFTIIAEGVETVEQLNFLQQYGCHEVQGYYISKPQPIEQLLHLLDKIH
jgi:diguanylate cyclase